MFRLKRNHAIDIINPISLMRLYRIAWRMAVFACVCVCSPVSPPPNEQERYNSDPHSPNKKLEEVVGGNKN